MRQQGFTYLALLFAVAIMGAVLGATSVVWRTMSQRDKEQDLLFVGHAYRKAIEQYYESTPGTSKQYPKKLEDLIEDKRQTKLTRHIRKLYADPITASKQWGIVKGEKETISGVYSLSDKKPIKTGNFEEADMEFEGTTSYQAWRFVFQAKSATPGAGVAKPSGTLPVSPPLVPPAP